jgi:hypothetical protein
MRAAFCGWARVFTNGCTSVWENRRMGRKGETAKRRNGEVSGAWQRMVSRFCAGLFKSRQCVAYQLARTYGALPRLRGHGEQGKITRRFPGLSALFSVPTTREDPLLTSVAAGHAKSERGYRAQIVHGKVSLTRPCSPSASQARQRSTGARPIRNSTAR